MALLANQNRTLNKAAGFALIELLVVISILAVLAGVVLLSITQFIGEGVAEAYAMENKQVHTAATCYLVEGNRIDSEINVGPGNLGVLAPWLTGNLKYYWSINTDGSVDHMLFSSPLTTLDGFTVLDGTWTAGPGGLSANGDAGSLLATGGNWDDFNLATTVTFTSDDGYTIAYRSDSDADNGYLIRFDPILDTFTVTTVVDGVESSPLASVDMPSGFSGQHDVSVSVNGNSHTISVDGTTVMAFDDSTFGSGTVGLQSPTGSYVNFTGFTVSPP